MTIKIANKSHTNQLLFIANNAFGSNFISPTNFEGFITQSHKNCFIAVLNNEVLGFVTTQFSNANQLQENLLVKTDEPLFTNPTTIGIIKQVAVHPNHLRKGIATNLLKHAITHLKLNSDSLFCISWKKGNETPMSNLLLKNNFTLQQTTPNYWYNDSLTQPYNCAICGTPPCKCSAELFIYHIKTPPLM